MCNNVYAWYNVVLVEKILRVQPDVRKLYLLVRSPDAASAQHRVLTEVRFAFSLTIESREDLDYE